MLKNNRNSHQNNYILVGKKECKWIRLIPSMKGENIDKKGLLIVERISQNYPEIILFYCNLCLQKAIGIQKAFELLQNNFLIIKNCKKWNILLKILLVKKLLFLPIAPIELKFLLEINAKKEILRVCDFYDFEQNSILLDASFEKLIKIKDKTTILANSVKEVFQILKVENFEVWETLGPQIGSFFGIRIVKEEEKHSFFEGVVELLDLGKEDSIALIFLNLVNFLLIFLIRMFFFVLKHFVIQN